MWDTKFEDLLRRQLPYLGAEEKLEEDTPLREFGLDSLAMVELLSVLERTYDVRFEDDALTLDTFKTPGILWKTLSGVLEPAN
ncbi:acyl carrier protein [Amycolatopsis sp. NPDC059021]|uniref:acyl carrier protein n=1 Tax=Amycolatopsis sp. NPDC059021 TaxID=3346704 RepID=UPI003671718A